MEPKNQEEAQRVTRVIEKMKKVLEEENCRAEAVVTFFGSSKIKSEVQIVANPRVAGTLENPVQENQQLQEAEVVTQPEGGVV